MLVELVKGLAAKFGPSIIRVSLRRLEAALRRRAGKKGDALVNVALRTLEGQKPNATLAPFDNSAALESYKGALRARYQANIDAMKRVFGWPTTNAAAQRAVKTNEELLAEVETITEVP